MSFHEIKALFCLICKQNLEHLQDSGWAKYIRVGLSSLLFSYHQFAQRKITVERSSQWRKQLRVFNTNKTHNLAIYCENLTVILLKELVLILLPLKLLILYLFLVL